MTGAQVLAAALATRGVNTLFGLLGDGNLMVVEHLVAGHDVDFVATRHEHAAVCAALGWAHATGEVGVATTTHGPGLAQTTSAVITAVKARLPVLVLTGGTHPLARLHAQRADQRALAVATGAAYVAVRTPTTIVDDLAVAFRLLAGGPVVLDVDLSVMTAELAEAPPRAAIAERPRRSPTAPAPDDVRRAAALLEGAGMPLVLLGRGAATACDAAESLADRIGARIGTTLLGQSLLPDHPAQLGVIGGFATPATRAALEEVDVVLAVGASLTRYTVDNGRLFADVPIIQIDRDPRVIGDPVPVTVPIVADAAATLQALDAELPRTLDRGRQTLAEWHRSAPLDGDSDRVRDDPDGSDPRDVLDALDQAVPVDRGVVVGVGHYSGWAALGLPVTTPDARLLPWDFGAVGIALGAAIGMAKARPDRPTVCIEGDGGLMMTLPELDTIARESLPVLVVVMDDRGFGAEAHLLRREGLATDRAWIPTPDLVATARGLGLAADSARGDGLASTIASLMTTLPALLHVPTSRRAVHAEIFAALGV